jgi:hypothetical protein
LVIRGGDRNVKPEPEDLLCPEVKMAVKIEKIKMLTMIMML